MEKTQHKQPYIRHQEHTQCMCGSSGGGGGAGGQDPPLEKSQKYRVSCGAVTYKRINVTDAEQTEKMQKKNVYLVMDVVSVALKVVAEVVRSAYVPYK